MLSPTTQTAAQLLLRLPREQIWEILQALQSEQRSCVRVVKNGQMQIIASEWTRATATIG
jgi:hypothetical protein